MSSTDEINQTAQAFETLLRPVFQTAYGVAVSLTHNRQDAEDLLQEAILRAYGVFDRFEKGTNFKAWILKILTTLFLNEYRKKKTQPVVNSLEDASDLYLYFQIQNANLPARCLDPLDLVLGRLEQERVAAAVASLPIDYRIVAALYFFEELSYQEIAEIVFRPIGTVRSRLHRARKMLQKGLWQMAVEQGIVAPLQSETEDGDAIG